MDKQAQVSTASEVQHNISGQNERMYQAGLSTVMLGVTQSMTTDQRECFVLLEWTDKDRSILGYGNADEIEMMASAYASGAIQVLTRWQNATAKAKGI